MQEIVIIGVIVLALIRMILKHNKDFSLELQVKILGLNIKIQSKEKKHPSSNKVDPMSRTLKKRG